MTIAVVSEKGIIKSIVSGGVMVVVSVFVDS
jgi:hypothetical protein